MRQVDDFLSEPVRVGVIGLGNMGRHHVRVLAEMPDADLIAVADVSEEARAAVERSRPLRTYRDYTQMLDKEDLEAVVIALPTSQHEEAVLEAIDTGVHFLVEKPLAANRETAESLAEKARASGLVTTVGHLERYNPVVTAAKRGMEAGELGQVFQLRANRTGPLPERVVDVGVVVDLATHDFDVVRFLIDQPIERVYAETAQRMHSNHEDLFSGLMRFADGTIALLDVNWLTPIKIREMRMVGEGGMYLIDLLAQDLYFYENSHVGYWSDFTGRQGVSEGNMVKFRIDRAEPLFLEHRAFLGAIRGAEAGKLVTLDDGVAAVTLADAVKRSAELHRAVWGEGFEEYAADRVSMGLQRPL
jgi:predicted dehydrogenase